MKKLFKLYIFTLVISLLGVVNVAAAKLEFDKNAVSTFNPNQPGTIDIYLRPEADQIERVSFTVSSSQPNSMMTLTIAADSSVKGDPIMLGNTVITALSPGAALSEGIIATLLVKNTGFSTARITSTITISNIVFTKTSGGGTINGTNVTKNITLTTNSSQSNNPLLTQLAVVHGTTVFPFKASCTSSDVPFKSTTKKYKVCLKDTIKNIVLTYECDNCQVAIICENCSNPEKDNKIELKMGKNIITIKTTSADKAKNDQYEVVIYRGDTTDNSNFLTSLKVDGFTLNEEFDKKLKDFTLTVPFETNSLYVFAEPEDSAATVDIKGGEVLDVGDNVIIITVTSSETKDKRIYNLTVTRQAEDEKEPTTTEPIIIIDDGSKPTNWWLIGGIIGGAVLVIVISALAIFGKKRKNKKQKPEKISDDGKIPLPASGTPLEVLENELRDEMNITEEKNKPTVDEALADLMSTKEIAMREEENLKL